MQDSKISAEKWHSYWLIVILALAASVRFYALGDNSLSAESLLNVSFCNIDSWFAMMEKYTRETGLPFVYPTLLCQFADLTAAADFFIRAFSVVMGVGVIFLTYLFGLRFFSPLTGLLAAAIMAVDYQSILIDRSVTAYSLFALLCLLHLYIYCGLLWDSACKPAPLVFDTKQATFQLKLHWAPDCPCHAGSLLAFWGSGLLAFYTNPSMLIVFIVEAVGVLLFAATENRKKLSLWFWLPTLLGVIPYLLTLMERLSWLVKNDLLDFVSPGGIWLSQLPLFSHSNNKLFIANVGLLVFSLVVGVVFYFFKIRRKNDVQILVLIAMLLMAVCTSMLFIKILDPRSFLFLMVLLSLLLADGLARIIEKMKWIIVQNAALGLCVFMLASFCIGANVQDRIYTRSVDMGFEWAAKIIAGDSDFMLSKRTVVTNSPLFNFYLDRYGISQNNVVLLKEKNILPEKYSPVGTDFYYLEYAKYKSGFSEQTTLHEEFSKRYKKVCAANKKRFRITRFSTTSGPGMESIPNCSDYLKVEGGVL